MPKIFVDDFNSFDKILRDTTHKVDIYPVDYDYCVDYISNNVEIEEDNKYHCYTCMKAIDWISDMSDFEITVLSCGHLHHTGCLLSDTTRNMKTNYIKCIYCNNNDRIDVIKSSLETTYYACILAYDMKNPDYISKMSDFSQRFQETTIDEDKKKQTENETMNIKFEIKVKKTEEKNKPVLRRSARLIENNKSI